MPRLERKASVPPSGDHRGDQSLCGLEIQRWGGALPSAGTLQRSCSPRQGSPTFRGPGSSKTKTTVSPSGEICGLEAFRMVKKSRGVEPRGCEAEVAVASAQDSSTRPLLTIARFRPDGIERSELCVQRIDADLSQPTVTESRLGQFGPDDGRLGTASGFVLTPSAASAARCSPSPQPSLINSVSTMRA